MRFPLKWINEFTNIEDIDLEILTNKLILAGFEVEEIFNCTTEMTKQEDIILDISCTANRADTLSISGLSREIAAIFNRKYKEPELENNFNVSSDEEKNKLRNENTYLNEFLLSKVSIDTKVEIPNFIKDRLEFCGYLPQNTLQDIRNYIILETGYPFELYDFDKIESKTQTNSIDFSYKFFDITHKNEVSLQDNFINDDENTTNSRYKLNPELLCLYANNELLEVAGISQLNDFKISTQTKNLLIEGANFRSSDIRRIMRQLGFEGIRASIYKKGVSNDNLSMAYNKLIKLVSLVTTIKTIEVIDYDINSKIEQKVIQLTYEKLNNVLGKTIDTNNYLKSDLIKNYLQRLNFQIVDETESLIKVKVPNYRINDIEQEIDLVEEIGRLHGFNNFITQLPESKKAGNKDETYRLKQKFIQTFLNLGFNETMQYSLTPKINNNQISLANPLNKEIENIRNTLLFEILQNYKENERQGNDSLWAFEFGRVINTSSQPKPIEIDCFSGVFSNYNFTRLIQNNISDNNSWFIAKGKIERIFKQLNLEISFEQEEMKKNYHSFFNKNRTSYIYLKKTNKFIGIFGQINPIFAKEEKFSTNLYLFEFNFTNIKNELSQLTLPRYEDSIRFPKIKNDISFLVNKEISFKILENFIFNNTNGILKNIQLLEEYNNLSHITNLETKNLKSLLIELTFQSEFRTLRKEEIDNIITHLKLKLKNNFEINFRS